MRELISKEQDEGGKAVKRWLTVIGIAVMLVFTDVFPSFAKTEQSYIVGNDGVQQKIPLAYEVSESLVSFPVSPDTLSEAQDICTDSKDRLYILDSGNSRVLVMSSKGEFIKEIKLKGKNKLSGPQGIFVDADGKIYIADTENGRILVLNVSGKVLHELTQPKDKLYDREYPFKPIKVGVNSLGQIYAINKNDYHGFCILNADNQFKGYFAATRLQKNATEEWIKKFASQSQKEQLGKTIPAQHTNFQIAEDGSIYVTTANVESEQMKRLSAVGTNFYPFTGSFGDKTEDYFQKLQDKKNTTQKFVDVTADGNEIVSILDNTTGRIYQYDNAGVLLAVFGGSGNWEGRMMNAVAIAQDSKKRIYVLDKVSGSVQCFVPTQYILKVHQALQYHEHGEYKKAKQCWKEILIMSPEYTPAHIGLGKAEMKEKNYTQAMQEYKRADDISGYAQAYAAYLKLQIQEHFLMVALLSIVFVVTLLWLVAGLKRKADEVRRPDRMLHEGQHIALLALIAPWEAFRLIIYDRKRFHWFAPTFILMQAVVLNLLRLFILNFPAQSVSAENINMFTQISEFLLPFVLWTVGFYYVSCIFGGEVRLKETYAAGCYAWTPYVVFVLPVTLLTYLTNNTGTEQFLMNVLRIWVVVLIYLGIKTMNHYTAGQTIGVMLVSVFAALILALVLTLFYLLGNKFLQFLSEVTNECKLYFI